MKKDDKTNVHRVLDQKKIEYTARSFEYKDGEPCDAVTVAAKLGKDITALYKTLVTKSGSGNYYVFVIPGAEKLDYKKAAKAVGEKSLCMIPSADLLGLTGYIHGGCSPIGMKKLFPTVFHEAVLELDTVTVSAGKIGKQVEIAPDKLIPLVNGKIADIIVAE